MSGFYVKDGAAWRLAQSVYVNDGAAWRKAKAVYVNDGAAWRLVYQGLINLSGAADSYSPAKPTTAKINYLSNGTIADAGISTGGTHSYTGPANWYVPTTTGIGSSYYIRFTLLTGAGATSVPSIGTLAAIGGGASLSLVATANTARSATVRVDIYSDSGGTNLVASGTISLTADGT